MLNSIHWVVKLNTLKDGEKHKDVENFKIMEKRCYSIASSFAEEKLLKHSQ